MRNPPWHRDELILALDLYFNCNPSSIGKNDPKIIKLSKILNALPIYPDRPNKEKFRNPNGVYMKLMNFRSIDPSYSGKGLSSTSKLDKPIWDEFSSDMGRLHNIAHAIISAMGEVSVLESPVFDEELEFPEGRVLYRKHKLLERNRSLVTKAKEKALRNNKLQCGACGFDFNKVYGALGRGYIECHHTIPISEYSGVKKTRLEDLALVCSNCHRMLHRKRPWLTLNELSALINI